MSEVSKKGMVLLEKFGFLLTAGAAIIVATKVVGEAWGEFSDAINKACDEGKKKQEKKSLGK